jgi:hypothetical protein
MPPTRASFSAVGRSHYILRMTYAVPGGDQTKRRKSEAARKEGKDHKAEYLDAYLKAAGIADAKGTSLWRCMAKELDRKESPPAWTRPR